MAEPDVNGVGKQSLQDALQVLQTELDQWQDNGQVATFWWRDDDANQAEETLDQLLQASALHQVPLALATIPDSLASPVARAVLDTPTVTVLQHGFSHKNYALEGQKKMELGLTRPLNVVCAELKQGQLALEEVFAAQFQSVLVPPWNRIADEVVNELPQLGYSGYSTFGVVDLQPVLLGQANMHVDIIDWRNTRRTFAFEQIVVQIVTHLQARRHGAAPIDETTGFMTHHLVHDKRAWEFIDGLFALCQRHDAARWLSSRTVFDALVE